MSQARQINSLTLGKGRRLLPFLHNPKQLTACMVCDEWAQDLSQNTVSSVVGKDSPSEEVERPPVELGLKGTYASLGGVGCRLTSKQTCTASLKYELTCSALLLWGGPTTRVKGGGWAKNPT